MISSRVEMLMTPSPDTSSYFLLHEAPATGHITIKLSSRAMVSNATIMVVGALDDVPLLIILCCCQQAVQIGPSCSFRQL